MSNHLVDSIDVNIVDDGACIIATPGDERALCGGRVGPVAICWQGFVQRHIDGDNPVWCATCLDLWSQLDEAARTPPDRRGTS